ncbi:hypothetical protein CBL_03138 [Carabus blaptoides fortunei]
MIEFTYYNRKSPLLLLASVSSGCGCGGIVGENCNHCFLRCGYTELGRKSDLVQATRPRESEQTGIIERAGRDNEYRARKGKVERKALSLVRRTESEMEENGIEREKSE